MYKFSRWQQQAADYDARIQALKQELLYLERMKQGCIWQHFHGAMGGLHRSRLNRKRNKQNAISKTDDAASTS
jgi:hypothetical protein